MKIVLLGAPSCGKGVQAKLIENKFCYKHISIGQILRDFIEHKNEQSEKISKILQSGGLISDKLMCEIVSNTLSKLNNNNYILDGFPRTKKQAKFLIKNFCPDMVLYLQTDKEVAIDRVINRVVCPKCKKSYNKKELSNLICPNDNSPLEVRLDDNYQTYIIRYKKFEKVISPIINIFEKQNLLYVVQNNGTEEETFAKIEELIKLRGEKND